uniref:Uncharacterized protein n=1 Tax=Ceratitis capitata TaxID=7213 RepID=W8AM73_CERCA
MYKDSSCRSSPQPTPPKVTPTTTAITATAEAASDNNTVDAQASSKESIAITTTTKSTTATTKTLTAESTASDRDNKTGQAAANKCDDSTPSAATTYTEPESPTDEFTVSASTIAATRIIETSPATATSAPHLSNSTSTGTGTGNTPITLSLAAEHLEAAEYYQLSCASDCSVSSSTSLSSAANTSCGSSASDDSDENSEVYTFRARPAFPAHVLQSAPKRRAHWRREHAHAELSVDVDSRRGSAVSGWSGVTGVSGGGGSSSGQRRRHHAQHASVSADVRALRKIGYIASRVRFLAKIYGDFKLVNPYSPAKQRKQLQDILLRHSIPETDRKGAAAASGYRKKRETTAHTVTGTPPISQRSLTPDSSLASSSCKAEVGVTRITRAPRAEEEPTLSSFEDDDEAVVENIAEDVEDAEEEEEETSATFTAGTVRRKSSVLATSATAYDATRARSLAVLEELLVQFYEQRQHRITVIRRRHLSRRGSSTRGNGKIAGSNSATAQQPQHLIIMSGGSAVSTDSNASQHLMHTNAPNDVEQQTNLRNANNLYNNSDATAELVQQGSGSGTPSVASNISSQTKQKSTQPPPPPQQHQHQQQRSYSNAFLQPPFSGIGGGCMDRRRRASDCSAHPSSQQLLQQQLLSNQLQVTLKNNNFTVGGGKFPYHRGSCGGAGEHLLAANTIANRSTIILSKSCSNVEGVPTTAAVAATAAALYGDSTRKFSLGGHVDAPSNGNLVSSPALTPSPTAKQPYTTSSQSQQQQQQQSASG